MAYIFLRAGLRGLVAMLSLWLSITAIPAPHVPLWLFWFCKWGATAYLWMTFLDLRSEAAREWRQMKRE